MSQAKDWGSLREFAEWYMALGAPLMCPPDVEVYVTDDAVTFPIFRHKNFQVELYVLHNPLAVPLHGHPYVEVLQSFMTGDGDLEWSVFGDVLTPPAQHGGESFRKFTNNEAPERKLLLTFERWPANSKPSTLAAVWKGDTVGPMQEQLIRRLFPKAYVVDGYADITRSIS
jgi:hypothetical protein